MSQSSSNAPAIPPVLPASALFGDPGDYIMSIDPGFRAPVCTMVLLYIHRLRGVYHDNGTVLMALAQIEHEVTQGLYGLLNQNPVTSRFVPPPSP